VNRHREPCPVSRKSLAGCPDQRECRWLAIRCRVGQESYVRRKMKIRGTTSFENETGYIDALEDTWTSSIALSGFLLEGGLMAPESLELDMLTGGIERKSMDRTSRIFDRSPDSQ